MSGFIEADNISGVSSLKPMSSYGLGGDIPKPMRGFSDVIGTVEVKSVGRLEAEEDARRAEEERAAGLDAVVSGLGAYVKRCFDNAKIAKQPIEIDMLMSLRQVNGEYESDVLDLISQRGGSTVYMLLTAEKCRSADAWLEEVYADNKIWGLKPTTNPSLPAEDEESVERELAEELQNSNLDLWLQLNQGRVSAQKELRQRAEDLLSVRKHESDRIAQAKCLRMEKKIEDQFEEGGWDDALSEFRHNLTRFPTAFLKGPTLANKRRLTWGADGRPSVTLDQIYTWSAPSPFDIFPAPDARSLEGGFLIERQKLTRRQLEEMRGLPGVKDEVIEEILENASGRQLETWAFDVITQEYSRRVEEDRTRYLFDPESRIGVVEFWGEVSGKMLREWGMSEEDIPDPAKEYSVQLFMCREWVFKCVLNPDPTGAKPYYSHSYTKKVGSFWGNSIPFLVRDIQNMCNAAARAMYDNMSVASGPQAVVDVDQLPAGEDVEQIYPWKIWQASTAKSGRAAQPVSFFAPPMISSELMKIYEFWEQSADNKTGIPKYAYGAQTGGTGALSTSSGFAQMMNNASKSLRAVVTGIDKNVVKPAVERQFIYNMLFDGDESIKGDVQIVPEGANNLAQKEQQSARRNEFFNILLRLPQVQAGIGQLMNLRSLAVVMNETLKGLNYPADLIPSMEEISQMQRQQDIQAAQQQALQFQAQQMSVASGQGVPGGGPSPANSVETKMKRMAGGQAGGTPGVGAMPGVTEGADQGTTSGVVATGADGSPMGVQ